jgi:hypothetical protein
MLYWIRDEIGPGAALVSNWDLGFDRMITKVSTVLGETAVTKGLAGIQDQLQWINDEVGNVANQYVSAFARMQDKTASLVGHLDNVIERLGIILEKTTGEDLGDGIFATAVDAIEKFINQFRPKKKPQPTEDKRTYRIGPYEWEAPSFIEELGGLAGASTMFSGRARYDPVLQGTGDRTVTVQFGNVTINDTADMATFGATVERVVRDALGAP